jgi:hypothetical protein
VPYGGRMVPWLCFVVSTAVLFTRDVVIGMIYWMSGAVASYCVGAPSYPHAAHPTSPHTERENTVQLPAGKAPPDGVSYEHVHFSFDI